MKLLYPCIYVVAIVLLSACYKDHGNYNYDEAEKITITGIDEFYSRVSLVDRINIQPQVSTTAPNAKFTYWWGIYEAGAMGKLDTISHDLKLNYLITQPAKEWSLVFGVKNEATGISKTITSSLNVTTIFTRGWYVMKHQNGQTDLDLFFTPESIIPRSKMENLLFLANDAKVEGEGRLFGFNSSYAVKEDGILHNKKVFFVQTSKDLAVVDINSMSKLRQLNELFYETPSVKAPGSISRNMMSTYLINDGKLHSLLYAGQFGNAKMKDDKNTPYHLSPYFLINNTYEAPVFFDETSSSFVSVSSSRPMLLRTSDRNGSQMPANNNNKELLFMGIRSASPFNGVAVFRDKTDPDLRIVSFIDVFSSQLNIRNDTLPAASKMHQAERYGLVMGEENIIYFSTGNEIWSRNLSNGTEQLQFAAPAGERISFIRHRKYTGPAIPQEQPFYYNYILVGTTANGRYKMHAFKKSSGNLASSPDFTLEGEGAAADVIYLSPLVNDNTYHNTY